MMSAGSSLQSLAAADLKDLNPTLMMHLGSTYIRPLAAMHVAYMQQLLVTEYVIGLSDTLDSQNTVPCMLIHIN